MTSKQDKGWFGELMAKFYSGVNGKVTSSEKRNNKGFDYREKDVFNGEEAYVEVKANKSNLTKSQRAFRDKCLKEGKKFRIERVDTEDLFDYEDEIADFDEGIDYPATKSVSQTFDFSSDKEVNDLVGVHFNNNRDSVFYGLPD